MLKQRVITGIALALGALLALLLLPPLALALLLAAAALVALWEWSDLAGLSGRGIRALYCLLAAAAMFGLTQLAGLFTAVPRLWVVAEILAAAALFWFVALWWVAGFPDSSRRWSAVWVRAAMGWLVLLPAWFALVWLRLQPQGQWLILVLLALVAAADIGAYFSGRALGRRKLAPAVSPGKSWEGFWGGVVAALLLVALPAWWLLWAPALVLPALLAVAALTVLASVLGDLVESMLKRQRGVKDSGALLPGHGGVMDRLDSLSAAAPIFALGLLLTQW